MKGLTHFMTGLAFASCFPHAVQAGADGNPLPFILGGACGLLPDTLDFKVARYFFRHDVEIIPDPSRPDPQLIATTLAAAIHEVRASRKTVRIKINTARVGPGLWDRYRITFDETNHRVAVAYGGVVTTGQAPASPGFVAPAAAISRLACSVKLDYEATTEMDIFEGPSFAMEPLADGRVFIRFIPWHRQWSHSLTFAAALGLGVGGLGGLMTGVIAAGACALHIAADQLGFMGSNLFFPFTRRRLPGRQLMRSDHALANFATVWVCALLIYWNLARLAPPPLFPPPLVPLLLYGAALPLGLTALLGRRLKPGCPGP